MSNWSHSRIGDIAEVKGGKRLPKGLNVQDEQTEYKYLRVTNFSKSGVDTKKVKFITKEAHEKTARYVIYKEDVYISIAGTIGLVGIIPEELNGANLTENAAKICNISDEMNHQFLMYFLRSEYGQGLIAAQTVGTSQPKLALFRIKDIEVPKPALLVQEKIVSFLSTYDNLIENNNRRIAILEDMAQSLYREWFVHLRFPGHKNCQYVDSELGRIPEGWEVNTLKETLELAYGKALKKADRKGGAVAVYGSGGLGGWHNDPLATGPCIIVGRKGNVGKVFWVDDDCWPIDTVFYVISDISKFFVYYNLCHQVFHNSDAAVPGLNREAAYSNRIIIPTEKILLEFDSLICDVFEQLKTLRNKNKNLENQRDLLLPKLISGGINIE